MNHNLPINWKCEEFKIKKYDTQEDYNKGIISSEEVYEGNLVTNIGLFTIFSLLTDFKGTDDSHQVYPLSPENTYIAIGLGQATGAVSSDIKLNSMGFASSSTSPMTTNNQVAIEQATYPSDTSEPRSDRVVISNDSATFTLEAQYGTGVATGTWTEWGIYNGNPIKDILDSGRTNPTSDSVSYSEYNIYLINHKVENMGTKSNTAVWVVNVTISLRNAS